MHRQFSWVGQIDCCMWLADYVELVRGIDPGREWRGRYRTKLGAARILKRAGGIVALIDDCLKPLAIRRTDTMRRGDIAVVLASEGATGAIALGSRTTARLGSAGGGLRFGMLPVVAAWRI